MSNQHTYKQALDLKGNVNTFCVLRSDGACLPFDKHNTDYQQFRIDLVNGATLNDTNTDYQKFKHDIQNGVTLNDASGNPITGDALTTFISTLP